MCQKGKDMSPFMQLFWEEQKKAFDRSSTGVRYHAMIIRFCLLLQAKSPANYEEWWKSRILILPSQRMLRDYKNAIHPEIGFNEVIILELNGNICSSLCYRFEVCTCKLWYMWYYCISACPNFLECCWNS